MNLGLLFLTLPSSGVSMRTMVSEDPLPSAARIFVVVVLDASEEETAQ